MQVNQCEKARSHRHHLQQRMPVGDRDFVADGCESPFQLVDRGETHAGEDLKHTTREILEAFQNFL